MGNDRVSDGYLRSHPAFREAWRYAWQDPDFQNRHDRLYHWLNALRSEHKSAVPYNIARDSGDRGLHDYGEQPGL